MTQLFVNIAGNGCDDGHGGDHGHGDGHDPGGDDDDGEDCSGPSGIC